MPLSRYFLCFVALSSCLVFPALGRQNQDTVYQKNGEIIVGTIIEDSPGNSLRIKLINNNVWLLYYRQIEVVDFSRQFS